MQNFHFPTYGLLQKRPRFVVYPLFTWLVAMWHRFLSIYPALQINIPLPGTMKNKKTTSQIKFSVVTIK